MTELTEEGLHEQVETILRDSIGELLEGAADDVERYLHAIALDLTRAIARGDQRMVQTLKAQVLGIAASQRVYANNEVFAVLTAVVDAVGRTAIGILVGGLAPSAPASEVTEHEGEVAP